MDAEVGMREAPDVHEGQAQLERKLSLPLLVLYGMGTTIGAGVYALLGVVVESAGMQAPITFLIAAVMAGFTALSFCELSSRLPHAGGEAVYVAEGLRSDGLARLVGVAIAVAACISAATVARGFVRYVADVLPVPEVAWLLILMLALGALAAWGISESAFAAALLTLVEAGGLVIVIVVCGYNLVDLPARAVELVPGLDADAWLGVGGATLLCFYAFLGFEDMVNVAEEVQDVRRVLPLAILFTVLGTAVLYVLVSTVAVLSLPAEELAKSKAPLVLLFEHATGRSGGVVRVIGVFAMLNGALIQIIKCTRILYGLGARGQLPAVLARIHPATHTPVIGTCVTVGFATFCAILLPIGRLAQLTSGITIGVFVLANLALFLMKRRGPAPEGAIEVPGWIPLAGFAVSSAVLVFELVRRGL